MQGSSVLDLVPTNRDKLAADVKVLGNVSGLDPTIRWQGNGTDFSKVSFYLTSEKQQTRSQEQRR